ncbi:hypothetical protein Tco_1493358 [Tanacetum coccineum]
MQQARKQQVPKETITLSDTTALAEFDQKTTLFETMTKSKSFNKSPKQRALYHALMESILKDEDVMDERVVDKLKKRKPDNANKDKGPSTRSDRGLKRRKTSKDTKPSKKANSTESSKGTSKSQPKSTGKSAQAEEAAFEARDTQEPQNQGQDMGNTINLMSRKIVNFRPPQTWISKIDQAEKSPLSFDELMSTPIDFSAYVMNHLNIDNLTQDHLNKPEGKEYPFDLSNPLSLIMERGRQVIPVDYIINNDLEYLREGRSSKKYTTSTTKTKASKYDIPGIKDMVPLLWSTVKMFTRRIVILKRVEDLQLGVKSYQKKLNITKPETFRSNISNRFPYTAYNNPQGIIYEDKYKRNRLNRTDELYKFSDGTHTSVRIVLHNIASNLRMDY